MYLSPFSTKKKVTSSRRSLFSLICLQHL